jgi:hypothetical protein
MYPEGWRVLATRYSRAEAREIRDEHADALARLRLDHAWHAFVLPIELPGGRTAHRVFIGPNKNARSFAGKSGQ